MAIAVQMGLDAKIYRNTGSYASPVWSELVRVKDVTLTLQKDKADVSHRGYGKFKASKGSLRDLSVTFMLQSVKPDANRDALRAAWFSDATIEFAVMDGDITTPGSEGIRATMEVFNFSRNEQLAEGITYDVEISSAIADQSPEWMVIE